MPLDPLTEVMKYYAVGSRQVGQQSRQVVKHDLPRWRAGCRKIGVMVVFRIDMNEYVEHVRMLAQHPCARRLGNAMPLGNADPRRHLNMRIDQRLMRHAPRPQFVQAAHSGCRQQGLADRLDARCVETGIDQFLERPQASPAPCAGS